MKIDYSVTLEQEVLRELSANVYSRYGHYIDRNNIHHTDSENVIIMIANEAFDLKDYILTSCNTPNELGIVKGRLLMLMQIIERLEEHENRRLVSIQHSSICG